MKKWKVVMSGLTASGATFHVLFDPRKVQEYVNRAQANTRQVVELANGLIEIRIFRGGQNGEIDLSELPDNGNEQRKTLLSMRNIANGGSGRS